jgi:hypothetical protein
MQHFCNQHLWADESPSAFYGDNLFMPHIVPNRLTGWNYKAFMENNLPSDHSLKTALHAWWRSHTFSLTAFMYLNQKFPGRCIGRGGPSAWPLCSSDLNPLKWSHLELAYLSPINDVETLWNWTSAGFLTICNMPRILDHILIAMKHWAEACIRAGSGHAEHSL